MNFELANETDNRLLKQILDEDRYKKLRGYEINVQLFYKYGKRDKDDNLVSPALQKYGKAIYAQTKLVSTFNRITDEVDVKIILNKDLWDELSEEEKLAVLDNQLAYIEVKEDKEGEPIPIAEDSDKVQLKLKNPDFFCEGFIDIMNIHKENYIPWQDAMSITDCATFK